MRSNSKIEIEEDRYKARGGSERGFFASAMKKAKERDLTDEANDNYYKYHIEEIAGKRGVMVHVAMKTAGQQPDFTRECAVMFIAGETLVTVYSADCDANWDTELLKVARSMS